MSSASLVPSHVFGINTQVKNNICYLDESSVLYPSGTYIVQYNLENRQQQKFIPIHLNENESIGYMTMSPASTYLAVGTQVHPSSIVSSSVGSVPSDKAEISRRAVIFMFDWVNGRRKRTLLTGDSNPGTDNFISICFSHDGKYVFAQGSQPDWNLYVWTSEKGKLLTYIKSTINSNPPLNSMSVNPFDTLNNTICVTGQGLFRLIRFVDGSLKVTHQQKHDRNILCHAWVSDNRIICGTSDSKLLLFEGAELILEISYIVPNVQTPITPAITSIISYSGGLLAGLSTGVGVFFEKTDDNYYYKKTREFLLEEAEITCISLSPQEEVSAVSLNSGQMYLVTFDSDSNRTDEVKCDRLAQSFHAGGILGLATSVSKPLAVTCGSDKTIRVWNYQDSDVEVVKHFEEVPQSVSIHPNGFYIVVAFQTSLKLMALLIDDIRQYWEATIRGCREVRFSNGGNLFAAIWNGNVALYNTWSFEMVGQLRPASGKVKKFFWSTDDTKLLTISMDGSMSLHSTFTFKREWDISHPDSESQFISAALSQTSKSVYALSTNGAIYQYENGIFVREIPVRIPLNQIVFSKSGQLLFGVSSRGTIVSFKFPFPSDSQVVEMSEHSCHSGPINKLTSSFDDQFLLTVSDDGCFWIFKLVDREGRSLKKERDWNFSDEILVTKSDLRENYRIMTELRQRVEELKAESDTQLKIKDAAYASKINDVVKKFTEEVDLLRETTAQLKKESEESDKKRKEELAITKQTQQSELWDLKAQFNQKMESESQKFAQLVDRQVNLEKDWIERSSTIDQEHSRKIQEATQFYQKKLLEKAKTLEECKTSHEKQKIAFEQKMTASEANVEDEYIKVMFSFETKLKEERESLNSIKAENMTMRSKFDGLTRQIEDHKKELSKAFAEEKRLQHVIRSLENDIEGIRHEIQERDDTIMDKEKRIYDLKKKNQELEKFKLVLDYKILELRKQVEPREQDIADMSEQIQNMLEEMREYHAKFDKLDLYQKDLILRHTATQKDKYVEEWRLNRVKTLMKRIERDLIRAWKTKGHYESMKRVIGEMYQKYRDISTDPPQGPPLNEIPNYSTAEILSIVKSLNKKAKAKRAHNIVLPNEEEIELAKVRQNLEKTVDMLKKKLIKSEGHQSTSNHKIAKESIILVSEVNALRKDLQNRRERLRDLHNAFMEGKTFEQVKESELERKSLEEIIDPEIPGELLPNMPLPPILPPK